MRRSAPDDSDDEPVAEGAAAVVCPYCGEPSEISLDPSGGTVQDYVEDCQVCCQPWRVHVRWRRTGRADVDVETTDG
jgi:Cysteine-rich CPXCG